MIRRYLLNRRISKIQRDEWPLIMYLDLLYSLLHVTKAIAEDLHKGLSNELLRQRSGQRQ